MDFPRDITTGKEPRNDQEPGMTPAPPFDCAQCGRRIGKTATHLILKTPMLVEDRMGRVVCIRHHAEHYDAGRLEHGFCTRAAAANLLGIWPRKKEGDPA